MSRLARWPIHKLKPGLVSRAAEANSRLNTQTDRTVTCTPRTHGRLEHSGRRQPVSRSIAPSPFRGRE